jgi:arylsulfatase A-like enzyme
MKNATLLPLLGYGLLTAAPILAKETASRPNIIFILSDDHAKTAISAYGGINAKLAPTPNIDRIAQNGTIFNNMLCTNAISGPSRACLITGKYSNVHGLFQNEGGIVFDSSQPTVQSILKENGYTTSIIGKWHLNSMPAGFDYFKIHDSHGQQGTYWDPLFNTNGVQSTENGYSTKLCTDASLEWMSSIRDKSKPFCMMLNFKAPHRPWEPDSMYMHLFDDITFPYPASFNDDYKGREQTAGESMATIENHLSRGDLKVPTPADLTGAAKEKWLWYGGSGKNQHWTPNEALSADSLKRWKFQQYIKNYLRCVRSVDDNVGRVLDYLKENGLDKNTIIVYMGDQGFYLGEHGWYDKRWMYEESLQMACIIRNPGVSKPGSKVNALALNVDITPTLLDFAGVKVPSDMQGVSLMPVIKDEKAASPTWRKAAYYQYFEYPKWHNVQPHFGVRTDRYKLIHFYFNVDIWEFYDLQTDPTEMTNQYNNPKYKVEIAKLKLEIAKQQKQYGDDLPLDQRRKLTEKYMLKYAE